MMSNRLDRIFFIVLFFVDWLMLCEYGFTTECTARLLLNVDSDNAAFGTEVKVTTDSFDLSEFYGYFLGREYANSPYILVLDTQNQIHYIPQWTAQLTGTGGQTFRDPNKLFLLPDGSKGQGKDAAEDYATRFLENVAQQEGIDLNTIGLQTWDTSPLPRHRVLTLFHHYVDPETRIVRPYFSHPNNSGEKHLSKDISPSSNGKEPGHSVALHTTDKHGVIVYDSFHDTYRLMTRSIFNSNWWRKKALFTLD